MLSRAAAEDGGQDQRERQERDHQEPLGDPEERPPPASPRGSRRPAPPVVPITIEMSAGQQADEQGDPGAPDQLGQDRPAAVVGAQPALPGRRFEHGPGRLRDVQSVRVRQHRREDGHER